MHGSSVKTFKQKKIFWQIDNYGDNHKECEDGSHINVGGDDDDDGGGGDDDDDGGNDDDGDDGDDGDWQEPPYDGLLSWRVGCLQIDELMATLRNYHVNEKEGDERLRIGLSYM